jgi:hypothetical protein
MSEEINEYTNERGESDREKQVHGSDPSSYDCALFEALLCKLTGST